MEKFRNNDLWKDSVEDRLINIETTLGEMNEVFQTARGGFKMIEFFGNVTKSILPIVAFVGIIWAAFSNFPKH